MVWIYEVNVLEIARLGNVAKEQARQAVNGQDLIVGGSSGFANFGPSTSLGGTVSQTKLFLCGPGAPPLPAETALQNGGFAEQRLHLGIEVRHRRDQVVRPELERLRPFRGLEREDDFGLARLVPDDMT